MKYLATLIFGFIFVLNSLAQDYVPVLNADTVQWNYLSDTDCGDCVSTLEFKVYGDTILNDSLFRKVFLKPAHFENNPFELIGFIHEDTINGRLHLLSYAYECQDDPCINNTIYDMGLNIGDTLVYRSLYNSYYQIVTNIDSLDDRKIIQFGEGGLEFIEGIGSTRELTIEGLINSGFSELLCVYHNNRIIYSRKVLDLDTCNIFLTTDIESFPEEEIQIFPNPSSLSQIIEINAPDSHNSVFQIFSMHGSLVYSGIFSETIFINPNEFTSGPGIYIYRIINPLSENQNFGLLVIY